MNLIKHQAQLNGRPFYFFQPEGDQTIFGTMSCLNNDKFHLSAIPCQSGDTFVDLGCNVGLVSLAVAIANPEVRIFAFDASPVAVGALRCAIAANQLLNLQVFHVAIGGEDQKDVQFYSNGKDVSCLVKEGFNSSNPVPDAKVNQVSIDTIFDSPLLGIGNVRYLKMDVESQEYPIFDRLFTHRSDILERIDYLHVEIHPYQEMGPQALHDRLVARFGERVFFDT